jgi:hypothetical protein
MPCVACRGRGLLYKLYKRSDLLVGSHTPLPFGGMMVETIANLGGLQNLEQKR